MNPLAQHPATDRAMSGRTMTDGAGTQPSVESGLLSGLSSPLQRGQFPSGSVIDWITGGLDAFRGRAANAIAAAGLTASMGFGCAPLTYDGDYHYRIAEREAAARQDMRDASYYNREAWRLEEERGYDREAIYNAAEARRAEARALAAAREARRLERCQSRGTCGLDNDYVRGLATGAAGIGIIWAIIEAVD